MAAKDTIGWAVAGATLRGPSHRRAGLPNQDAWLARLWTRGAFATVADGLGSRPLSHLGSRAACRSVGSALRRWRRGSDLPVDLLLRAIHLDWRLHLHPQLPGDCATTCLFGVISGEWLTLGQLGDGVVAALLRNEQVTRLEQAEQDFSNETTGLGLARDLSEWRTTQLAVDEVSAVLLATDGVSEELDLDRLDALMTWLSSELQDLPRSQRSYRLARELRALDGPGRTDDRTLAVILAPPEEKEAS